MGLSVEEFGSFLLSMQFRLHDLPVHVTILADHFESKRACISPSLPMQIRSQTFYHWKHEADAIRRASLDFQCYFARWPLRG